MIFGTGAVAIAAPVLFYTVKLTDIVVEKFPANGMLVKLSIFIAS